MSPWASVIGSIFYYVILCLGAVFYFLRGSLTAILDIFLVILAPVIHLISYIAHGFLMPVYFLSKFEVCCSRKHSGYRFYIPATDVELYTLQKANASNQCHSLFVHSPLLCMFADLQQTLYIYLGVAALIGLFTGSLLHFSSSILIRVLDLQNLPEDSDRTAASVRVAREKKRHDDAWQASTPIQSRQARARMEYTSKDYSEYIENNRGKRKEGHGLLSQTILEEDDDSADGF